MSNVLAFRRDENRRRIEVAEGRFVAKAKFAFRGCREPWNWAHRFSLLDAAIVQVTLTPPLLDAETLAQKRKFEARARSDGYYATHWIVIVTGTWISIEHRQSMPSRWQLRRTVLEDFREFEGEVDGAVLEAVAMLFDEVEQDQWVRRSAKDGSR